MGTSNKTLKVSFKKKMLTMLCFDVVSLACVCFLLFDFWLSKSKFHPTWSNVLDAAYPLEIRSNVYIMGILTKVF